MQIIITEEESMRLQGYAFSIVVASVIVFAIYLENKDNLEHRYEFITKFESSSKLSIAAFIFTLIVTIVAYFTHGRFLKKFKKTNSPIDFLISDISSTALLLLLTIMLLGGSFFNGESKYPSILLSSPLALTMIAIFTSYTFGIIIPRAISSSNNLFYRSGYISLSQLLFGVAINITSSYITISPNDIKSQNASFYIILLSTFAAGYTEIKKAYLYTKSL